jgi:hypothetical protein
MLALEVMLQERIRGGGLRVRAFLSLGGPVGEPGRGIDYRGLTCGRRRAPLSIGAPLGRMGGPFKGSSEKWLHEGSGNGASLIMVAV